MDRISQKRTQLLAAEKMHSDTRRRNAGRVRMNDRQRNGSNVTAGAWLPFAQHAGRQMSAMVEECLKADQQISAIRATQQGLGVKGGFAAEVLHKETFNLDAILNNKDIRAFTDKCHGKHLQLNHPVHDILLKDPKTGEVFGGAQLKYYADAETTATQLRDPQYATTDQLIAPADQIEGVREAARKAALKNQDTRPAVADAAQRVSEEASGQLRAEGVESGELTLKDARTVATNSDEGKGAHVKIQDEYKLKSTLTNAGKAAATAAVVSSIVVGTLATINNLTKVRDGHLTPEEAVRETLATVGLAALDAAVKAGGATIAVSQAAQHIPQWFSGSVFQSSLAGGAVAGAAVCAIDVVQCLVKVASGRMTWQEMQDRTGMNVIQTGAGVVGATVGAALGAPGGPIGSFLGSFIGGMIASLAATVAVEGGIEKPYRQVLANAQQSLAAAQAAQTVSARVIQSAQLFQWLDQQWRDAEEQTDQQLAQIRQARASLAQRIGSA